MIIKVRDYIMLIKYLDQKGQDAYLRFPDEFFRYAVENSRIIGD